MVAYSSPKALIGVRISSDVLIEGAVHGGQIVLKTMESVKADWGSVPPPSAKYGVISIKVMHYLVKIEKTDQYRYNTQKQL